MPKKKPEPNPIEEAIGDRTKPKEKLSEVNIQKVAQDVKEAVVEKVAKMENPGFPLNPSEIADVPSPSEMLTLEELNRRTEARLQENWPEEPQITNEEHLENQTKLKETAKKSIPVSKSDFPLATETSSLESPVETIEKGNKESRYTTTPTKEDRETFNRILGNPAEDVEFTALKKYILEDGFVLATVAFHIVSLCAEPLTTPSTTNWDFADRASIPDMVLALLNQPGYLEGIWPSLQIVMGSNKGNSAWCAGIATTIAFFDTIRVLPTLKKLRKIEI